MSTIYLENIFRMYALMVNIEKQHRQRLKRIKKKSKNIFSNLLYWQNITGIIKNWQQINTSLPPELVLKGIRYKRTLWMAKRSNDFWENIVLKHYTDIQWIESFRMSKASFLQLCELIEKDLKPKETFLKPREPLTVQKQVAVALYKLASCAEYRVIGNVFGIHKSTVKKVIYNVVNAINRNMAQNYIKMPNEEEAKIIAAEFEKISSIPQIIGIIDGTHIPIRAPEEGYRDYVNRKGWTSYNVQAIVDHNGRYVIYNYTHKKCNTVTCIF